MSNQLKSGLRKSNKKLNVKQLKTNKMETKNNLPYGIKQPTTVQEFRENLKKYYITVGNSLYTQSYGIIPLNKISNFDDIYKITKTGFYGNGNSPSITPKLLFKKDICEWMIESFLSSTFYDYYQNEEYYEIIRNQEEFMERGDPMWYTLDNQVLREFYILTLGDYCGYSMMEV